MKPTIRDIAKTLDLSLATVSLALRGKGNFSPETRALVKQKALELGYSLSEKALRTEKLRRTLGVLLVIDSSVGYLFHFIRTIIENLERRVREDGYDVVLIPISFQSTDSEIVEKVLDARVKAVASLHYANINAFIRLEDRGIPIVVVMNNTHVHTYYTVGSDDFRGAYDGTKYLIDLGHRALAYVGCDRFSLETLGRERFMGFMSAIHEFHLDLDAESHIEIKSQDINSLRKEISTLIARPVPPTALFVIDDELALWVHKVLQEYGLTVPNDISIIAPGDVLDYSKPYVPQFTTMRINTEAIGSTTGELMVNRIKHSRHKWYGLKVNQELVDRGSCSPPLLTQLSPLSAPNTIG